MSGLRTNEYSSLHQLFEVQAGLTPFSIAIVDGKNRVTYSDLNARANRLAHHLRSLGVCAEVPVALCLDRTANLITAVLGILKAGGAYVPIDPDYPTNRIALILEDSKPRLVVTETRFQQLFQAAHEVVSLDCAHFLERGSPDNPAAEVSSHNLSYILFTSGSTGRPKGVALEHRSGLKLIEWARSVYSPGELGGTLFSTSICFDLSVFEIFAPLSVGATIVLANNILALNKLPAGDEVTLINTVPSAFSELLRMKAVPSCVRVVNLAGEALSAGLVRQIYESTNVQKVYNLYGPTEDGTYSTWSLVPRSGEVTIGRPLPGTDVHILDENREKVSDGVPGEIYLAGEKLARGYFNRPDLTKERFLQNPFTSGDHVRMYRTGDLGRLLPNGDLQYLGRVDNQVKLRGYRIELGEIESALLRCGSVETAVVSLCEDDGDPRLVAHILPAKNQTVNSSSLRLQLEEWLPGYMIPEVFVVVDAFLLTLNGKIDRTALRTKASAASHSPAHGNVADLEAVILRTWKSILGTGAVGLHDNFFDLGGNSFRAARIATELERIVARDIPLDVFLHAPTVTSLAEFLRNGSNHESLLTTIQPGDGTSPLFAVVSPGEDSLGYALLARHMGVDQTVFRLQAGAPVLEDRPFTEAELDFLSRQYQDAMRSAQETGPYCLCAMCDGVQIAERMVLNLESEGLEVGFLAVFDTWVLQHTQVPWLWKLHYYQQRLSDLSTKSLPEKLRATQRALQTRTAADRPSVRVDWQEAYWPKNFASRKFQAPVILFKRPKQPFYYVNDPQMGWGSRSLGGVQIEELEFHHQEILHDPHVHAIGQVLATRTREISAQRRFTNPRLTAAR